MSDTDPGMCYQRLICDLVSAHGCEKAIGNAFAFTNMYMEQACKFFRLHQDDHMYMCEKSPKCSQPHFLIKLNTYLFSVIKEAQK
jgi:hypothetical protein